MLTVRIQVIDGTGTFTLSDSQPCRLLTSLHRYYPASAVLRTSPPPQGAQPVPRGRRVGHPLTTPWGLPCCVRFPCVHAVANTPPQRLGAPHFAQSARIVSAFPDMAVGSACA